jgi:hypothetical protein
LKIGPWACQKRPSIGVNETLYGGKRDLNADFWELVSRRVMYEQQLIDAAVLPFFEPLPREKWPPVSIYVCICVCIDVIVIVYHCCVYM